MENECFFAVLNLNKDKKAGFIFKNNKNIILTN